ncbi:MAG: flippase-like domain-containing protein [Lachnospiraceae bacterium]|nr:flippase-like domain-containing protein [Lachnospiraceae bacterium]
MISNKEDKKKSKYKHVIWAFISLLLAIFTINTVLKQSRTVSMQDLADALSYSKKCYLIPAVISAALYVWFEGLAIRSILKGAGHKCRYRDGLIFSTSDIFFSAITPSATGGQPVSAFFMYRSGISAGVVSAVLVLNIMMYTLSAIILGIFSICIRPDVFWGFGTLSKVLIIAGLAVLIILSLMFLSMLKKGNVVFSLLSRFILFLNRKGLIRRPEPKLARIERISGDYEKCSTLISGNGSIMLYTLLLNLLQRVSQIIVPMLIYLSLGGDRNNSFVIFAKQCLITIGCNFVPIPGAMGISDYLMIDGFTELMGWETAFSTEMISRGITFYICVAVCGLITLIGYLAGRKKNDRSL